MADSTIYLRDIDTGDLRPVKLIDNGDGTFSFGVTTGVTGMVVPRFDTGYLVQGTLTDTYTYYLSGHLVATLVVTYTDSTKNTIDHWGITYA